MRGVFDHQAFFSDRYDNPYASQGHGQSALILSPQNSQNYMLDIPEANTGQGIRSGLLEEFATWCGRSELLENDEAVLCRDEEVAAGVLGIHVRRTWFVEL